MDIGFTGTQLGMTEPQLHAVRKILEEAWEGAETRRAHHGDCIGADAEFHKIATDLDAILIGHPPVNISKRAFCAFHEVKEPKPYLERNHDIVRESELLVATPKGHDEELRSGTWSTIRFARRHDRKLVIVLPDGSLYNT